MRDSLAQQGRDRDQVEGGQLLQVVVDAIDVHELEELHDVARDVVGAGITGHVELELEDEFGARRFLNEVVEAGLAAAEAARVELARVGDEDAVELLADRDLAVEYVDFGERVGAVDRVAQLEQVLRQHRDGLEFHGVEGLEHEPLPDDGGALQLERQVFRAVLLVAEDRHVVEPEHVRDLLDGRARLCAVDAAETLAEAVRVDGDRERDVVLGRGHAVEAADLLVALGDRAAERLHQDLLVELAADLVPFERNLPLEVVFVVDVQLGEPLVVVVAVDERGDVVRELDPEQFVLAVLDLVRHVRYELPEFLVEDVEAEFLVVLAEDFVDGGGVPDEGVDETALGELLVDALDVELELVAGQVDVGEGVDVVDDLVLDVLLELAEPDVGVDADEADVGDGQALAVVRDEAVDARVRALVARDELVDVPEHGREQVRDRPQVFDVREDPQDRLVAQEPEAALRGALDRDELVERSHDLEQLGVELGERVEHREVGDVVDAAEDEAVVDVDLGLELRVDADEPLVQLLEALELAGDHLADLEDVDHRRGLHPLLLHGREQLEVALDGVGVLDQVAQLGLEERALAVEQAIGEVELDVLELGEQALEVIDDAEALERVFVLEVEAVELVDVLLDLAADEVLLHGGVCDLAERVGAALEVQLDDVVDALYLEDVARVEDLADFLEVVFL